MRLARLSLIFLRTSLWSQFEYEEQWLKCWLIHYDSVMTTSKCNRCISLLMLWKNDGRVHSLRCVGIWTQFVATRWVIFSIDCCAIEALAIKIQCYTVHPSKDISPNAIIQEITHSSYMLSIWISHTRAVHLTAVSQFPLYTKSAQNAAFTQELYASLTRSLYLINQIYRGNCFRIKYLQQCSSKDEIKKSLGVFQKWFNSSSDIWSIIVSKAFGNEFLWHEIIDTIEMKFIPSRWTRESISFSLQIIAQSTLSKRIRCYFKSVVGSLTVMNNHSIEG